ncbi:MAG: hypothetical protein QG656_1706 [Candidatus Hydrogenedentes bacterium]|nr:hypothetical protein [Candidatus Hydrogenedentota bacterium]
MTRLTLAAWLTIGGAVLAGCATGPEAGRPTGLLDAQSPAVAIDASSSEFIVSVSPARQTMQIGGSSTAIIGLGIDAVVNDRYKRKIDDALQGYDAGAIFRQRLTDRLNAAVPKGLTSTSPLTSYAGFHNKIEAEDARYAGIAKGGADVLLDIEMTYGVFGPGGTLVAKLDGEINLVPEGKELWDNTIVVFAEPILASEKLTDPTKQLGPDFSSIRLTVEDNAIDTWTKDGGAVLKKAFEESVDAAVSALMCDLGLAEEAIGEYYLGKLAMNRKEFAEADAHFQKAIQLDPAMLDAQNGRAVNLAHHGQLDDAIGILRAITESSPEYGPAWFNLAWWYATEKEDAANAKTCYEKAKALGMPAHKKLDKLGK